MKKGQIKICAQHNKKSDDHRCTAGSPSHGVTIGFCDDFHVDCGVCTVFFLSLLKGLLRTTINTFFPAWACYSDSVGDKLQYS